MTGQGISQILVYALILVAAAYPLGIYMARAYGDRFLLGRGFGWLRVTERGFYRLVRTDAKKEQDWKSYGKTVLIFSVVFSGVLYGIQRLSLIHISEPTRQAEISYAVFCLKKKKNM